PPTRRPVGRRDWSRAGDRSHLRGAEPCPRRPAGAGRRDGPPAPGPARPALLRTSTGRATGTPGRSGPACPPGCCPRRAAARPLLPTPASWFLRLDRRRVRGGSQPACQTPAHGRTLAAGRAGAPSWRLREPAELPEVGRPDHPRGGDARGGG